MNKAIETLNDELVIIRMSIYHANKNMKSKYEQYEKEIINALKILENSERQSDIIKFGMWLCGHDDLTIEQMYKDFTKRKQRHDV